MNSNIWLELIKILLQGLTAILAIYFFLKYSRRIQSSEIGKTNALGDVSFLYEATPKVYSANNKKILEIEIKLTNKSSNKLGILGIFVKFKPIAITENLDTSINIKFDNLKDFQIEDIEKEATITRLKNIAFVKDFIWQTSIDGVSVRRSFDILSDKFCEKYPLVMVQIIIFGSGMEYIDKTHYPIYKIGKLRMPWCRFVEEKEKENYIFFGRVDKSGFVSRNLDLNHGERVLINKDGSVDVNNTLTFNPLLRSIINSNIEKVIELK